MFTGTAKPSPATPPSSSTATAVVTPITCPRASRSGPPELPLFNAASVWITSSISAPLGDVSGRARALTIPAVTVRSRPNGLPIATTASPTSTSSEFPSRSGVSAFAEVSTCSTARSVSGSVPTTRARTRSRLEKLTLTSSAPSITCRFVTT